MRPVRTPPAGRLLALNLPAPLSPAEHGGGRPVRHRSRGYRAPTRGRPYMPEVEDSPLGMGSIAQNRHHMQWAGAQSYAECDSLEFRVLRVDPHPRRQGDLVVSTTVKSCVMVAVLPIMMEAEQYFSAESLMARSTLAGSRP